MQKAILMIILLFLYSCDYSSDNQDNSKQIITSPDKIIKDEEPPPVYQIENKELMEFVREISNIPSPSSNLRYVTQTINLFEVKFGDGIYTIISNDTSVLKLSCDNGNSMLPTFDCNDRLILKKIELKNDLNEGDIIVYRQNNGLTIHRLIKIENGRYYPRADNWNGMLKYTDGKLDMSDSSVLFEDIQYKVIGIIYK